MDFETRKLLDYIDHQMRGSLAGYIFQPSPEMIRQRFIERLSELIGQHVLVIAKSEITVTQIGDEIIMELGQTISDIARDVYGEVIMDLFAPNSVVTLPAWRAPIDRCDTIETNAEPVHIALPKPVPPEPVVVSVKKKERPKGRLWRGD